MKKDLYLVTVLMLAAGAALAQPPAPGLQGPGAPAVRPPVPPGAPGGMRPGAPSVLLEILRDADTDTNGEISQAEFSAALTKHTGDLFKRMDRNGDGVLTQADRGEEPGRGIDALRRLRSADTDGNGTVTFDEAKTAMPDMTQERFNAMDRNRDGVLSEADRPGAGGPGEFGLQALMRRADKDGNGSVSFEELQGVSPNVTKEQFQRMDRNSDGVLSEADRPAPPAGAAKPGAAPEKK